MKTRLAIAAQLIGFAILFTHVAVLAQTKPNEIALTPDEIATLAKVQEGLDAAASDYNTTKAAVDAGTEVRLRLDVAEQRYIVARQNAALFLWQVRASHNVADDRKFFWNFDRNASGTPVLAATPLPEDNTPAAKAPPKQ